MGLRVWLVAAAALFACAVWAAEERFMDPASLQPRQTYPTGSFPHSIAYPVISDLEFADPSVEQDFDGIWYAFASSGNNKRVQVADAPTPAGPWTVWNADPLIDTAEWSTHREVWAPSVHRILPGRYVMYYSTEMANKTGHHCIAAATSRFIYGPYVPESKPLNCHEDEGGSIHPAGFVDEVDNSRWIVYKVDGNTLGHGGSCNNGISPVRNTPIMLQQVKDDGVTPIGKPTVILDRSDLEGPVVESPSLARGRDGSYILFFSSYCYNTPQYDIRYAVSMSKITGPYVRVIGSRLSLLLSNDYDLLTPGAAKSIPGGGGMVFQARCHVGWCMHYADWDLVSPGIVAVS